jgi:hypothetical protein
MRPLLENSLGRVLYNMNIIKSITANKFSTVTIMKRLGNSRFTSGTAVRRLQYGCGYGNDMAV